MPIVLHNMLALGKHTFTCMYIVLVNLSMTDSSVVHGRYLLFYDNFCNCKFNYCLLHFFECMGGHMDCKS